MSWYCKNCGELSLRLICEHCGKPRDTRLRIALMSLIGVIGIPITIYSVLYIGNVYAVELLIGYNSNLIDLVRVLSIVGVVPMGYGWLFLLASWIDQDSVLKDYWKQNPNVKSSHKERLK